MHKFKEKTEETKRTADICFVIKGVADPTKVYIENMSRTNASVRNKLVNPRVVNVRHLRVIRVRLLSFVRIITPPVINGLI